jgi:hypothetical protein
MRLNRIIRTSIAAGLLLAGIGRAESMFQNRAGFSLRGSYWSARHDDAVISVNTGIHGDDVVVGGAGGWLSFYSGVGERGCIEFSIGGLGRAEVADRNLFSDHVEVTGAMPILIGMQFPLFGERTFSAFQPYVSLGGGPYILSNVHVNDNDLMNDEVTVKNKVRPGAYGALGGYFLFTRWFAFQGEFRYHMVNFNPDDDYSGYELGFGLAFFWKM